MILDLKKIQNYLINYKKKNLLKNLVTLLDILQIPKK
jgi:hypothetical protein